MIIAIGNLIWPLCIAIAWVAGEFGHRYTRLPRICIYGLVGFSLGHGQAGILQPDSHAIQLLVNLAFGLVLFELGYRINLRWLVTNPWMGAISLSESIATFLGLLVVTHWLDIPLPSALLISAIGVSSSPAAILRVCNELRSSGQVTERLLHLAACNTVLAALLFKLVLGLWLFNNSGDLLESLRSSILVLFISTALGTAFGIWVPMLLRALSRSHSNSDPTVAFALAVIVLVAVTHTFLLSPIIACLVFGLVARHRRLSLSTTQRNFGVLGDLLTILLFTYVVVPLDWRNVVAGAGAGAVLILARQAIKVGVVTLLSPSSGVPFRKGLLAGIGLAPMSVFAIMLLEQNRHLGLGPANELAALAFITLMMEILGPVLTQRCLHMANEVPNSGEAGCHSNPSSNQTR